MILIPELRTVVILPPRTASGTIKRAILETYGEAMAVYRHMEADGIPAGYERWDRVGVVREPVERLWSLFKFLSNPDRQHRYTGHNERLYQSTRRPFSDWIVNNEVVFSNAFGGHNGLDFFPHYNVRHSIPENRKSQFVTLRPDLGTKVYHFDDLDDLAHRLRLPHYGHHNGSEGMPVPELTPEAQAHVERFFSWDLSVAGGFGSI